MTVCFDILRPHCNQEINDAFWGISLERKEPRQRRINRVLDNLPFDDHPDIFSDRCELLEGRSKIVAFNRRADKAQRVGGKGRSNKPVKCYWNIFSDWKRNLDERRHGRRRRKSGNKGEG